MAHLEPPLQPFVRQSRAAEACGACQHPRASHGFNVDGTVYCRAPDCECFEYIDAA